MNYTRFPFSIISLDRKWTHYNLQHIKFKAHTQVCFIRWNCLLDFVAVSKLLQREYYNNLLDKILKQIVVTLIIISSQHSAVLCKNVQHWIRFHSPMLSLRKRIHKTIKNLFYFRWITQYQLVFNEFSIYL